VGRNKEQEKEEKRKPRQTDTQQQPINKINIPGITGVSTLFRLVMLCYVY